MAIYRTISMSFWTDNKVVDDFTPEDKYFYLYLFTNPHTNLCGCYEVSIKQIAYETGYSIDTIERLIKRFEEEHKVISFSKQTKELLLLNWHKYNWTSSEKFRKPLLKEISEVKCESFRQYLQDLADGKEPRYGIDTNCTDITVTVTDTDTVTVSNTSTVEDIDSNKVTNMLPNSYQEKEKAKEKEEQEFNQFWEEYPNHKGKKDAAKAFKRVIEKKETDFETLINAIHMQKKSYDWQKDNGRFVPMASTWLNGARWNDEFKPNPVAKTKPKNTLSQEMTHDYDLDELRRRAKE